MKFLAVVVFIIEVLLSHTPGEASGNQSHWLSEMTGVKEGVLRRSAHVVLFFLLSLFSGLGFGWIGVGITAVWCVLDEVTKIPIPGRHASAVDSLLNLGGCMLGMVVWVLSRSA